MAAFNPILGREPRVLILGSMPSQISMREQQYYGNPRNAFWWIMSELYDFDSNSSYDSRCRALTAAGISVWDVLHDCERPGSLDSAIVKGTEVPNDFSIFFNDHPSISKVIFNGGASAALFKRHQKNIMGKIERTRPDFKWRLCPSTSPAHASMSRHDKLRAWQLAVS
jgi:hypoxanthine-DNA glycosylase